MKEPELLLDTIVLSPEQQKILELTTKMLAGGFVLWKLKDELCLEVNKYRQSQKETKPIRGTVI